MHQKIDDIPDSEPPLTEGEIQRFSEKGNLPYKPTLAVIHAIGEEYGHNFSIKAVGIYATQGRDVPLTKQGFNGENAVGVVRDVIDDDLGINIPMEEMERCYSFLGLIHIAERCLNGNGKLKTVFKP